MGDVPWGQCHYCGNKGPLRITYFNYPIKCNCCSSNHVSRIEHCNKCEAEMPVSTKVFIDTKKLLDPVFENLFTKIS